MLIGYSHTQVSKTLQKEFNIASSSAANCIGEANKKFLANRPKNKEQIRAKYTAMLMELYRLSFEKEQYKTCRETIDTLAKIDRLFEPDDSSTLTAIITYKKSE